jgi:hypothetical protein
VEKRSTPLIIQNLKLVQPPKDETPEQKKKRQAEARKEARKRPFEQKESYRWVYQFWILDFRF